MGKLKEGDKVKVLRKPTPEELENWDNTWEDVMDNAVGLTATVVGPQELPYNHARVKQTIEQVSLDFKEINAFDIYSYPVCVLKKVKE